MKITSKVVRKWHNQIKLEDSVFYSVSHRDYIISMYEILGNSQSMKHFIEKYYSVFVFMLNRYICHWLKNDSKGNLKKVYITFKKDKSSFLVLDCTEEENKKSTGKFISPVKNSRQVPNYMNVMLSNMSSPSNSGNITPK